MQHCQSRNRNCRNFRLIDENVHGSAYVVCSGQCGCGFGIFDSSLAITYRTLGSDRRKLVGNVGTNDANYVILL